MTDNGEEIPNLYKMVEQFRNHYYLVEAQKEGAMYSAFMTTLQGQTADEKEKGRKSTCLCREEHWFKKCPYLIESCWPND